MLVGMLAGNVCQAGDWTHEASVSITGKSGNTEKNDYSVRAKSVWEEDAERLELTASYQYGESTIRLRDPESGEELGSLTEKSSDELIGGAHYTHMFQETLGWYARDEIEQDSFESIDLRNTAAAGLTWVAVDSFTTRFELPRDKFLPLFEARPEYLQTAFDQMARDFGSVEGYLRAGLGVTDDERTALRRLLLDGAG